MIHKNTAACLFLFMGMAIQCGESPQKLFQVLVNDEKFELTPINHDELRKLLSMSEWERNSSDKHLFDLPFNFSDENGQKYCSIPIPMKKAALNIKFVCDGEINLEKLKLFRGFIGETNYNARGEYFFPKVYIQLVPAETSMKEKSVPFLCCIDSRNFIEMLSPEQIRLVSYKDLAKFQCGNTLIPNEWLLSSDGNTLVPKPSASILPVAKIIGGVVIGGTSLLLLLLHYYRK